MRNYLHSARALVVMLLLLASSAVHAVVCNDPTYNGGTNDGYGSNMGVRTPGQNDYRGIAVPRASPDGTILWRSATITIPMRCKNAGINEEISFFINPYRQQAVPGAVVGVIYKGQMALVTSPTELKKIPTGYHISPGQTLDFSLTYTLVLVKQGPSPSSGRARATSTVFGIDGAGAQPQSQNFKQFLFSDVIFTEGGTCALNLGDANQNIVLKSINVRDLPSVGATAARTSFSLNVSNCSTAVRSARFIFEGNTAAEDKRYFANTGDAGGLAIRMGMSSPDAIITPESPDNEAVVAVSDKRASLNLYAEYVRTGALKAGRVSSRATVSIIYQ
ncbi:type 1 fimbrial protein [Herbaspirillum sp. LeCh32-8]|uniref:fimbrial protein n=1 Tax=Herbaspirillum sp. LeCh32-8 TaxID=2821356 RepID=UPI001AEAEA39|nr:fimbrial protein [Herbaspirillum sp. LeCh32-8]MBP0599453.1 type 1 fimbrial protein [Herbaspirillum sp. LeCh32-8]